MSPPEPRCARSRLSLEPPARPPARPVRGDRRAGRRLAAALDAPRDGGGRGDLYRYAFLLPSLLLALPALAGLVDLERRAGCLDLALSAPAAEAYFVRRAGAVCAVIAAQGFLVMLLGWLAHRPRLPAPPAAAADRGGQPLPGRGVAVLGGPPAHLGRRSGSPRRSPSAADEPLVLLQSHPAALRSALRTLPVRAPRSRSPGCAAWPSSPPERPSSTSTPAAACAGRSGCSLDGGSL